MSDRKGPRSTTKREAPTRERAKGGDLFRVLDTHTNIAPIVDACVVDKDGDKEVRMD
jgi:hypothetical protein